MMVTRRDRHEPSWAMTARSSSIVVVGGPAWQTVRSYARRKRFVCVGEVCNHGYFEEAALGNQKFRHGSFEHLGWVRVDVSEAGVDLVDGPTY